VFAVCCIADSNYLNFKDVFISIIVVFGFTAVILLQCFFLLVLYKLNFLNAQAIHLEIRENKKYKYMFNSL